MDEARVGESIPPMRRRPGIAQEKEAEELGEGAEDQHDHRQEQRQAEIGDDDRRRDIGPPGPRPRLQSHAARADRRALAAAREIKLIEDGQRQEHGEEHDAQRHRLGEERRLQADEIVDARRVDIDIDRHAEDALDLESLEAADQRQDESGEDRRREQRDGDAPQRRPGRGAGNLGRFLEGCIDLAQCRRQQDHHDRHGGQRQMHPDDAGNRIDRETAPYARKAAAWNAILISP